MSQTTQKALLYANKIRKNQRQAIIWGLRSKFIQSASENQDMEYQHHEEGYQSTQTFIFENTLSNSKHYGKIYTILYQILKQFEYQKKNINPQENNIFQRILKCDNNENFQLKLSKNNLQYKSIVINIEQFKKGLNKLPLLIKHLIHHIKINLALFKNQTDTRKYCTIIRKIQRCTDIRRLTQCFNGFIEAYCKIIKQQQFIEDTQEYFINYSLLQKITQCLIQTSCFKPNLLRPYAMSQQIKLISNAINDEMNGFKQYLHLEICDSICMAIKLYKVAQSLNLFNNYIYIIGNIFVSLSSRSRFSKGQQRYNLYHQLVQQKLQFIIQCILNNFNIVNSQNQSNILQVCSLIVWFTRNEILINIGIFNDQQQMGVSMNSTRLLRQFWLTILLQILKIIKLLMNINNNNNLIKQMQIIQQCITLLQIIYLQYNINIEQIQHIFNQLVSIKKFTYHYINHYQTLQNKINDFYYSIACQLPKQINIQSIIQQAIEILSNKQSNQALLFVTKLVEYKSKIPKQHKLLLFSIFTTHIDSYLENAKHSHKQSINNLLYMIHIALQASDYIDQNTLLNQQRVRTILQLCSKVWQEEQGVQNLIESIKILIQIGDREQYGQMMKQIILRVGYYEQLQILSEHANEQINKLVYQLYQLLQIM